MQWTWFATPDEPVAIGPPGMAGKGLGMAGWLGSKPTRHETRSIEVLEGGNIRRSSIVGCLRGMRGSQGSSEGKNAGVGLGFSTHTLVSNNNSRERLERLRRSRDDKSPADRF